jgi:hypothetical protein
MFRLIVVLHLLGARLGMGSPGLRDRWRDRRIGQEEPERGSVTIEQVLWAVAMIAIVGVVVVAIREFVTTQAGNIR